MSTTAEAPKVSISKSGLRIAGPGMIPWPYHEELAILCGRLLHHASPVEELPQLIAIEIIAVEPAGDVKHR